MEEEEEEDGAECAVKLEDAKEAEEEEKVEGAAEQRAVGVASQLVSMRGGSEHCAITPKGVSCLSSSSWAVFFTNQVPAYASAFTPTITAPQRDTCMHQRTFDKIGACKRKC